MSNMALRTDFIPPDDGPVTLEEFERLHNFDGVQELLEGIVVVLPPPKQRHSLLVKRVARILERHLPDSRIWIETGFAIGRHCPQPDVAVIHDGQTMERGWYAGAPAIAIEIASKGNSPEELAFKKELYLANGAREVWIVFDRTRTVEVYGPDGSGRTYRESFHSNEAGGEMPLAELFNA